MTDIFETNINGTIIATSYTYTLSPNKCKYNVLLNTESGEQYTYEEYNINHKVDLSGTYNNKRIVNIDCKNKCITYSV